MGKTRWLSSVTPAILLGLVIFASTLSAAEWKEQVLYSFQAFIEYNFLGENAIGTIGPTQYPFADVFAPEFAVGFIPLADFFPIPSTTPRQFQPIPIDPPYGQSYFQNYFSVANPNETPDGPDAGDSD
jgi:hypothetical protein